VNIVVAGLAKTSFAPVTRGNRLVSDVASADSDFEQPDTNSDKQTSAADRLPDRRVLLRMKVFSPDRRDAVYIPSREPSKPSRRVSWSRRLAIWFNCAPGRARNVSHWLLADIGGAGPDVSF
jgi:hypothetical protein